MIPVLNVYVPRPGSRQELAIDSGSGIVGTPDPDGERILIDYQGNVRFPNESFARFADRVMHAGGRHAWIEEDGAVIRYPTIARSHVPAAELLEVGSYDDLEGVVTLAGPAAEAALACWLETPALGPDELLTSASVRHMMRREVKQALASSDPRSHLAAQEMIRRYKLEGIGPAYS